MQLFALALIATVLPLSANSDGQPATATTAQAAAEQPAADHMICRLQYHEGEVIRRTVCHTQAEWNMLVKRNQQDFRTYQIRALIQARR